MNNRSPLALAALIAWTGACDGGPVVPPVDSGPDRPDAFSPAVCARAADCDDGVFCNSVERCAPGDPAAGADGCIRFAEGSACTDGDTCDEAARRCRRSDCSEPDRDDDGDAHTDCGGGDCDDDDPNRRSGMAEVCDSEGHDEDCRPDTWAGAEGDEDLDGFVAARCCGAGPGGTIQCGTDCDDAASGVNPGTPESCNGIDDDCDGLTDEMLLSRFYRDEDGDLYGDQTMFMDACAQPVGYATVPGDCNDAEPMINPAATEHCNGADDDCDDATDEESAEIGSIDHCTSCGDACQFRCQAGGCTSILGVSPGSGHTCAIDSGRQLYCWGNNDHGQLGDGGLSSVSRPRHSTLAPAADRVAAGSQHTCVDSDSRVYCWGDNSNGELGDGTTTDRPIPVSISYAASAPLWPEVHKIVATRDATAAIVGSGREMYCWGSRGVCGLNSPGNQTTPVLVPGLPAIRDVSLDFGHGCAVTTAGQVYCWGNNSDGEIGQARTTTSSPTPVRVPALSGVVAVSVVTDRSCALHSDGHVSCWGSNGGGGLGDGVTMHETCDPGTIFQNDCSSTPVSVMSVDDATALANSCVLRSAGEVWCWSDAGLTRRIVPPARDLLGDGGVTCSVGMDERLTCWGPNSSGQVGNGMTSFSAVPSLVLSPE